MLVTTQPNSSPHFRVASSHNGPQPGPPQAPQDEVLLGTLRGGLKGLGNGAAVGILGMTLYLGAQGMGVIMGSPGLTERFQPAVELAVHSMWTAGAVGATLGGVGGAMAGWLTSGRPSQPVEPATKWVNVALATGLAAAGVYRFVTAAEPGNWHHLPQAVALGGLALSSAARAFD